MMTAQHYNITLLGLLSGGEAVVERPVRIVTAGVDAETMAKLASDAGGSKVQVAASGDLQGARLVKKGVVDYYFGTCWSGGGGALAAATALLGAERVGIVATPGISVDVGRVEQFLQQGRVAFGFPYEQSKSAISVIVGAILDGGYEATLAAAADRVAAALPVTAPVPASGGTTRQEASAFSERFDVLEAAGQLDPAVRPLVDSFLTDLESEFGLQLREATASQFATHLAIAFTRLYRQEETAEASSLVADEIADRLREHRFVTAAVVRREPDLGCKVPQGEIDYMTVHVCALIDNAAGV